jgi:hypothetical protein
MFHKTCLVTLLLAVPIYAAGTLTIHTVRTGSELQKPCCARYTRCNEPLTYGYPEDGGNWHWNTQANWTVECGQTSPLTTACPSLQDGIGQEGCANNLNAVNVYCDEFKTAAQETVVLDLMQYKLVKDAKNKWVRCPILFLCGKTSATTTYSLCDIWTWAPQPTSSADCASSSSPEECVFLSQLGTGADVELTKQEITSETCRQLVADNCKQFFACKVE